eukprot:CAMPEP_0118830862 /NCGR_PEP_ID=MMETSP1162-20130426/28249_1 /TAXON_ID=33656 /ORGANISM="Phaeocystis Sp, Strain CCMP2710" /LENGTH=371 /DNA_ID=CAMNT_0006762231 /DNA_START=145 /DNA_END=1257 /DNA_ORIENTATION=-
MLVPSTSPRPLTRQPAPPHSTRALVVGIVEVELLRADHTHDDVEDAELAGGERADHDAAGAQAHRAQVDEAHLGGDVGEARHHAARAARARLVDLGEQGVRRVRDDGGDDARDHARRERDAHVPRAAHRLGVRAERAVDGVGGVALHRELGHGVRHLLEEDGDEAGVEGVDEAVLGHQLGRGADHALRVVGLRHEANAARLVRAEEDVGDELGDGGGEEVDARLVLPGLLLAQHLREVDLEELDAAELEPALNEVALRSRPEAGQKRARALLRDDRLEAANKTGVVLDRVKLDPRLHDVDGRERTVGHSTADAAGEGAGEEVFHVKRALTHDGALLGGRLRRHHGVEVLVDAQRVGDAAEERHLSNKTRGR